MDSHANPVGATPKALLSIPDGIFLMVGMVIGVGIFKAPSIVAGNTSSETEFLLAWLLGLVALGKPVVNPPHLATISLLKPYQLLRLKQLGFPTPRTLVTNDPAEAEAFVAAVGRAVAKPVLGGAFATIFFTLALTDLETRLLPNRIIYPSVIAAAALSWGWPDTSVVEIFAGGGLGILMATLLLLLSLPFGPDAFGMGDVKMIVLMGFVLGVPSVLVGVVVGTFAAGAVAAFLLITRLRGRRDTIPLGPFLALGAVIALWWGSNIWDAYVS